MPPAATDESSTPPRAARPLSPHLQVYRWQLTMTLSILHRISSVLLFLLLPILLCLLGSSLESPGTFNEFKAWVGNPLVKNFIDWRVVGYLHHLCAGIRHLALDLHKGLELEQARATSYAVFGVSILATLIIAVKLW